MNLLDRDTCFRFFLGQALTGLAANADFLRSRQEAACAPDSRLSAAERLAEAADDIASAAMERAEADDDERDEIAEEVASGRCCRACQRRLHFPDGDDPTGEPALCGDCGEAAERGREAAALFS